MGIDDSGQFIVQIYWIMGRSPNSQNRVFSYDDKGRLYTEAADPSKVSDPSLIIYNAMREQRGLYVVSNGDQTDSVMDEDMAQNNLHLSDMLRGRAYEPDSPNFTSRITGLVSLRHGDKPLTGSLRAQLLILQKSPWSDACERRAYEIEMHHGYGYCITTYSGDGGPLPAFRGDPLLMPFVGNIMDILISFWDALNKDNRIALAGKMIDIKSGNSTIISTNRFQKVVPDQI